MAETIKGINIKLSLDGQDLDNELKAINKELREQQRDLRAINTNLRYDSSNLDLWKKKQTQLNEVIAQTEKRLEVQQKKLEQARLGLKLGTVSDAEFRKLQRNITYNEADLKRLNNELSNTKDKIKDLGNLKFDNLAKVGSTLTKAITAPILGAVAALTVFANKGVETATAINATANKLRMSAEALQEWNHVARMSGVETASLEKAFEKVNSIVADIALGDVKGFAGVFHALGISMDEIEGKDTSAAFEVIRKALSKVEDVSLRAALANHLFGDKIGSEVLPVLGLEEQALNDLKKEAHDLGIVTNDQIDIVSGYNDSLKELKQSTTALSVEVAEVMIPAMQGLVNILKENVIPAFRSAVNWWKNLNSQTKTIIVAITGLVAAIGPVLTIVGKVIPLIKKVTVAIKAVGAAGSIAGIGINAATLGIGALVAIVAVALLKNEKFKELLQKLMDVFMKLLEPIIEIVEVLMEALMPILDIIIGIFSKLIDILMPLIDIILAPLIKQFEFLGGLFEKLSPLIQMVGNVLQKILVPAFQVVEKILTPIMAILEKIIGFFEKIFNFVGSIGDVVGDALGGVADFAGNIVGGIGDFVGGVADKVGNFATGVVDKVSGAVSSVGGFFGGVFDKVGNFATGVADKVSGAVSNVVDGAKSIVSGASNAVSNVASKVTSSVSNFANTAKDKVSGAVKGIGNFFNNAFNLKGKANANTSTTTNQATTNNSITINTTSPTIDIDAINRALGGKFIWLDSFI